MQMFPFVTAEVSEDRAYASGKRTQGSVQPRARVIKISSIAEALGERCRQPHFLQAGSP